MFTLLMSKITGVTSFEVYVSERRFEKVRIGCRFEYWTLISLGRRSESYIYI
jgi:hypothetical protein